ncbi:hypothetical protein HYH02_001087 [Chlamydomonas schloesseri]|uniref:5'-3' exonuclease domain-containing protein n=1 Tax=Chlamydomonas schloesseri TaxID=2026947 RepID=A0A835WUT9_9CHLO|nr:hypothetical protein HYH02_001087 [Chlamydomonas schloesseri]|eukprot:KAG2454046.1 hypothetical protein HYH02_001087 [Chlamydomonas schloesseri]
MQCRADVGWGVSHAQAFETSLLCLRRLTCAAQLFVVFDNKRGRSGPGVGKGGVAPAVLEERQALVPGYLEKRHARRAAGGRGSRGHGGGRALPGTTAAYQRPGTLPAASNSTSQQPQLQARAHANAAAASPLSSSGPARPRHPRLAEAEALMEAPPSHLVPFEAAVRRAGGLAMYGIPGLEADDLIASLTAGLLADIPPLRSQHEQQQQQQQGLVRAAAQAQLEPRQLLQPGAPAGVQACEPPASTTPDVSVTQPLPQKQQQQQPPLSVVVASGDSDMLQLLALPGVGWLELRQLSRAASAQEPSPLAVAATPALTAFGHSTGVTVSGSSPAAAGGPSSELLQLHLATAGGSGDSGTPASGPASFAPCPPPAPQLLSPAAYPDLLALVGKPEAGVVGAGLSAKSARKLLLRYGNVEGVARAHAAGELDDALRLTPLGNARASAAARAVAAAASTSSMQDTGTLTERAGAGTGGTGGSEGGPGSAAQSQGLQRALRNVRVTRMRTDSSTVPWDRLQAYQQERRLRHGEQEVWGGTRSIGSPTAAMPLSLPLHPHEAMHTASAAPYVAALAAALTSRGLGCRLSHMDVSGGGLVDLSISALVSGSPVADADDDGGGSSGFGGQPLAGSLTTAGGQLVQGAGLGGISAAAVERLCSELARMAAIATAEDASSAGGGGGGGSSYCEGGSDVAASIPAADTAPGSPATRPHSARAQVHVCVLSPWDFDADAAALQRGRAGSSKNSSSSSGSGTGGGTGGGGGGRSCSGSNAQQQQAPAAPDASWRLAAFAGSLMGAAGPRQSLCHTPTALKALLRPTSAWRLKSLQRGLAGGMTSGTGRGAQKGAKGQTVGHTGVLAVVPFYELFHAEK